MVISFKHGNKHYRADISKPKDLSIPIKAGDDNPNCYWADPVKFETIVSGDFVGNVARGGPVNYQKLSITPHGNGTHTECYGHISADERATITNTLMHSHFFCLLVSITPKNKGDDLVVYFENFKQKWVDENVEAVVIRTLPNERAKRIRKYSGTNPAYLDHKLTQFLNEKGVEHLIVDLPSVDREEDEGKLLAHKAFWGVPDKIRREATITELAYIDNEITDGLYLLNLQTISLDSDACPSRPVLFEITSF